ncbi:hypothetical protein HMSSN139_02950 [Paenibacillus sp. HMSSN-139]|nr:hypothetical protein HMSSN139_02950 [Paenibacillus sp. HMSSN-139]
MFKRNLALLSAAAILSLSLAGESFAAAGTFKRRKPFRRQRQHFRPASQRNRSRRRSRQLSAGRTFDYQPSVQLIVNLLGLELNTEAPKGANDYFSNVKNDAWYAPAFVIAQNNGFDLDAAVNPDKPMTREEFTHQLILAMEKHGDLPKINIKPVEFADDDQLNISYQGTVQRALVLGIAKLDANQQFHPGDAITRADAAVLTYNAVEYLAAHPAPSQDKQ